MGITKSARSLARRAEYRQLNVGRADRLIRVALALSLLMLGSFSIAMASGSTFSGVAFCLAALYAVTTAALGSDPVYAKAEIDTREDRAPTEPDALRLTEPGGLPVLTGSADRTR